MAFVREIVSTEHLMEAFVVTEEANEPAATLYHLSGAVREGGPAVVFVYPGTAA